VAQDNQVVIDFIGNTTQLQQSLQEVDKQVIKTGKDYETAFAGVNNANQQAEQGTKQLAGNLQDVNKVVANGAIKEYSKDLQGAVEKLYDQGKIMEALITKYGSASKALKEMQKELATMAALGQRNTSAFKELTKVTAELQDTIGDTRGEIKKLASDTKVFDTLVQGARGLAAGFSLVTGTMAAFGSENEDVQKTLLKVQGAMAALQGVQELANIATEEGGLATQAYGVALTVVDKISKITGLSMAASWAVATAGLTILIAGVISLIAYLGQSNEASDTYAKDEADRQKEAAKKQKETQGEKMAEISAYEKKKFEEQEFWRKKEQIAGKDVRAVEVKQLEENIAYYKDFLVRSTVLSQDYFEEYKDLSKEQYQELQVIASKYVIDAEIKRQDLLKDITKKGIKERVELAKREKQEADEAYFDELLKRSDAEWEELKKQRDDRWNKEIKDYREHIAALAQIKGNNEDRIKFEEDYYEHLAEIQTAFETMSFEDFQEWEKKKREEWKISEDAKLKQLHEIGVAQDKQRAEEEKMEKEAIAAAFSITKDISNALYQIESEKNKEKLDNKLSSLEKAKERELSNALLTAEQKTAIEEKYRKREAEEKRKAWKADQQAKAEQAIINGFLGFTASLATQGYPAGLITGLLAIANAGVQAGLILSQPVPQFAKGTEYVEQGNAPSGVDTVHARLNIGERVVPTEINKQLAGIKNEDLPKLLQAAYYPPMPHAPEMSGLNAVVVKQDIDYKKLGKVIAEELRANPQTHINIDKGGFSLHVIEKGKKVQSLNNRYES